MNIPDKILSFTVEVGDCLEWIGAYSNKRPRMRIDGKVVDVRRHIALLNGMHENKFACVGECGSHRCIKHIAIKSMSQSRREAGRISQRETGDLVRIKNTISKRAAQGKLTDYDRMVILTSTRGSRELAAELQVSDSLIRKVRAKQLGPINMFAALMR